MSDVLIKNMEMPKACYRKNENGFCPFLFYSYAGESYCGLAPCRCLTTKRPKDCPLVEVKEAKVGDLYEVKKAYVTGKKIWMEVEHGLAD